MLILGMTRKVHRLLNKIWWKVISWFLHIYQVSSWYDFSPLTHHKSGFHTLTHDLSNGVKYWKSGYKERLHLALQQMFPTSVGMQVESVTEIYHKYKREYLKLLSFNPDFENLSEFFLTWQCLYISSNNTGACTTGGSVHLLWHGNLWWDWEGREGDNSNSFGHHIKITVLILVIILRWQ